MNIFIKKLSDLATIPTRGSSHAAGYDLYSTEDYTLKPLERHLFKTNISIAIPEGLYGRIAPRSGLAYKDGIDVMAGVIDEDYRGDVGVILINLGSVDKTIVKGDKIAQIIFENYSPLYFVETSDLTETNRGIGGFGSTDNKHLISVSNEKTESVRSLSQESELIKIRSIAPKIFEATDYNVEKKYTESEPYHNKGKSDILEKWKESIKNTIPADTGYEKLIKDRENASQ